MLFALGLSTSRTLRAEKISQLISTHTRRNEAIVKVTFAPENGEEKEFSVARKIKNPRKATILSITLTTKSLRSQMFTQFWKIQHHPQQLQRHHAKRRYVYHKLL